MAKNSSAAGDECKRIRHFIKVTLHDHLREKCDVRTVAPELFRQNVVSRDQLATISLKNDVSLANRNFYLLLHQKARVDVLNKVSSSFKRDTSHENNVKLGEYIDTFLLQSFSSVSGSVGESSDQMVQGSVEDVNNIEDYNISLNDECHMSILQKYIIDEVPRRWKRIATALGFSFNKVEAIESDCSKDDDCLLTVFGLWLRGSGGTGETERTLQSLYHVLVDCDCRPEAENLFRHFQGMTGGPKKSSLQEGPLSETLPIWVPKLRDHVSDCYRQFKLSEGPYDIKYVRLAILKSNPSEQVKKKDQGAAPDHVSEEVSKSVYVEDLLKKNSTESDLSNSHFACRIKILYGQAGVGKTATMKHMCRQWTLQQMSSEFPLVLFFPLRDEAVASATDLASLLKYYTSTDPSINLDSLVEWMIQTKGKNVLFMFDGADEAKNLVREDSKSVLLKLLKGNILAESSIILSSRPGVCPDLQQHRATFYEIQGLNGEAIDSYVNDFFKEDASTAAVMLSTLKHRPDLMEGAYLPMNLFIYCSIFDPSTSVFPSTMTECYNVYTTHVYVGECRKEGKDVYIESILTDQSKEVKNLIALLSQLAFKGLSSSPKAFIFQENAIYSLFPSFERKVADTFFKGLLHVHAGTIGLIRKYTFNFSHATLQEFFAAHHLQQLSHEEQLSFWKEHIWDPSFDVVLQFYAGLSKLICEEVISCLGSMERDNNAIRQPPHQSSRDDPRLLILFHALYESQNEQRTRKVTGCLRSSLEFYNNATPFDLAVVSHCLSQCTHLAKLSFYSKSFSFHPDQLACIVKSNNLQFLKSHVTALSSKDARSVFPPTCSLEELHLTIEEPITLDSLSVLFSLKRLVELELSLNQNDTSCQANSTCNLLEEAMKSNKCLKWLCVKNVPAKFFESLSLNKSVEELFISSCEVSGKLPALIMPHLKHLSLWDTNPLPFIYSLSAQGDVLDSLCMRGPQQWSQWKQKKLTKEECSDIETGLSQLKVKCIQVDFKFLENMDIARAFSIGLSGNVHVNHIALEQPLAYTVPGDDSSFSICKSISLNRSIESLDLSSFTGEDVANVLNIPQLKKLALSDTDVVPVLASLGTRKEELDQLLIFRFFFWHPGKRQLKEKNCSDLTVAVSKAKVRCVGVNFCEEIDVARAFSMGLSQNNHVTQFTLTKPHPKWLDDNSPVDVFRCLSLNKSIEELSIQGGAIDDIVHVVNMPQLQKLHLENTNPLPVLCSLGTREKELDVLAIGKVMDSFIMFRTVSSNYSEIPLTPEEYTDLVTAVSKIKVRCLKLGTNQLDIARAYSTGLSQNSCVRKVELWRIPDELQSVLQSTIASNTIEVTFHK